MSTAPLALLTNCWHSETSEKNMLLIYCPHCLEHREEEEFSYGERRISHDRLRRRALPMKSGAITCFPQNPRGIHHEMWYHGVGCRRYFNATRNTLTYEILETYVVGTQPQITGADA